ncbi:hypothetical protein BS17DRAFT_655803, partial [Gyrodon lividus]
LYIIDLVLHKHGKNLGDFPDMPRSQMNWAAMEGNQLIAKQLAYDHNVLKQRVDQAVPTLNAEQRGIYDEVLETVCHNQQNASSYFLHSAGGCGKTYLCNLIAAAVCAQGKIVLCVASSGIASLLLSGGQTAHSRFKIPIPIHEASTCNIKKETLIMS